MQTSTSSSEIDYYTQIVEFYENYSKGNIPPEKIELFSDISIIKLMEDLKKGKKLKDADIKHVAKNSLILLLDLFDERCQVETDIPIDKLSEEEKRRIKKVLMRLIESKN